MAKEPSQGATKSGQDAPEQPSRQPVATVHVADLFTRKRLAILLCASLLVHAMGYGYHRWRLRGAQCESAAEAEVSLGAFRYLGDQVDGGRVARADFALHVAVSDLDDTAARTLLATHKYRIQQGIEELLRRARGGDFEDPVLREMKRRIQDRIEETLGVRVVADVIITDLKVQWNPPEAKATSETAESVPWIERPSG